MATTSKMRLKVGLDEARQAILDALPEDAIVRDEDDGVGRFAGARTLVIVSRKRDRLMMFHGSYGSIKQRFDDPHLDVVFDTSKERVVVRLKREEARPPSAMARALDVAGYMATVGIVMFAYYNFTKTEVDTQRIAIVAVVGGLAWAAIAHYMPKREDLSLYDLVDKALAPHKAPKKKKKAPKPEATEAKDDPADDDAGDNAGDNAGDDGDAASEREAAEA